MKIWDYLRFVANQMKEAHVKGDNNEVLRLTSVILDTLTDMKKAMEDSLANENTLEKESKTTPSGE